MKAKAKKQTDSVEVRHDFHVRINGKPIIKRIDGRVTREYMTTRGVSVQIMGYTPFLAESVRVSLEQEWDEQGKKLPRKPTYEIISNITKEAQSFDHDEKSLKTDEDREAWAEYLAANKAFNDELILRTLRAVLLDSAEFEIDPKWEAKARAKKMRVPDGEFERKLFFGETEVIGSFDDVRAILEIGARLGGMDERVIDAANASFRNQVEESDSAGTSSSQEG